MKRYRATYLAAGSAVFFALQGCAGPGSSAGNPRPGDYAVNYFSAPLSALYPGNYSQQESSPISNR